MGTSVRSGTARVVISQIGSDPAYGPIAKRLSLRPPETDFERGVRQFGYLLTQVMLVLVLIVFAANVFVAKPTVDSLLFAIALAVGLTPELLPAILSLTLARGAQLMAQRGVIVRRLNAIESLGSLDVLCTDKTGTLTEGVVRLDGALDVEGQPSTEGLLLALANAALQTGLANPLDDAIKATAIERGLSFDTLEMIDEVPCDFVRKRLSVVLRQDDGPQLVTKGALEAVLAVCNQVWRKGDTHRLDANARAAILDRYQAWSQQGFRLLGVAVRPVPVDMTRFRRDDERDLVFKGFLLFFDPPKPTVRQTVADLARLGVELKIITDDNGPVARHVAEVVGLPVKGVLTGAQIADLCQHTQVHPDHNQRELRQHVQHGWCPDRSGDPWIYRDTTISDPR
jgi:Mg2+-importing ATPase